MSNDFYEEDEPVEKVLAAFNSGTKLVTKHPSCVCAQRYDVKSEQTTYTINPACPVHGAR